MRIKSLALLVALSSAGPSLRSGQASAQGAVADVRATFMTQPNYVRQSAELVPEDKYGWKPTPDVRSFAELFAHVASNEISYCQIALGQAPVEDTVQPGTKAAMLAAFDKSLA